MTTYSPRELMKLIDDNDNIDKINEWLARGDGVAVYENAALDSSGLGDKQFISFGSPQAQLETDQYPRAEPPVQLPDIGNQINWRFRLIGTYRGEQMIPHIPTPDEEQWHSAFVVAERIVGSFTGEKYQGRPSGPFVERLSWWRLAVVRRLRSPGDNADAVEGAQRVNVSIRLIEPTVEIKVRCWLTAEGVNVLAPFDWTITDDAHGERTGTDPNLGGTVVSVYNGCLP